MQLQEQLILEVEVEEQEVFVEYLVVVNLHPLLEDQEVQESLLLEHQELQD
jgi:hypothetical protein